MKTQPRLNIELPRLPFLKAMFFAGSMLTLAVAGRAQQAIIVDHTCTHINAVPASAILQAKSSLHVAYGHTSLGSQLIDGMTGLVPFMNRFSADGFADNLFTFNGTRTGALFTWSTFIRTPAAWVLPTILVLPIAPLGRRRLARIST